MKHDVEELLKTHGVKPTPQRMVIAEFLLDTHSHPTADDVFQAVKDKLPVSLSRATVYNTLNALVAKGVIQEVTTEAGRVRYDANMSDHHHFVDIETGTVIDIPAETLNQIKLELGDQYKVRSFHVTIFGEVVSGKSKE
ncbi:MAG: transcriptional repressor [Cyanobacteria bacterium PR.3.49]|nr:transcriptional repressor [Cyanobacteria bacterium PR.3.49]